MSFKNYAKPFSPSSKLKQKGILSLIFLFFISFLPFSKGASIAEKTAFQRIDSLTSNHADFDQSRKLLLDLISSDTSVQSNAHIYIRLARIESNAHNFKKAQQYIRKLEKEKIYQDDYIFRYRVENIKASIHAYNGHDDLAIAIYRHLISDLRKRKNPCKKLSFMHNNLGVSYLNLNLKKAKDCFLKSINYAQKANFISYAAYNNLIDFHIKNLNYATAGKYIDTLLSHAIKQEKLIDIISAKTKRAHLFTKIGQAKEAKRLIEECRKVRQQNNIQNNISDLIYDSYMYHANGQLDSAIITAEPVLEHALQKKEMRLTEICMLHLVKLYTASRQFEKAINLHEQIAFIEMTYNKTGQIENIAILEEENTSPGLIKKWSFTQGWISSAFLLSPLLLFLWHRKQREESSNPMPADLYGMHQKLRKKNELLTKKELAYQQNLNFLTQLKTDIRSLGHHKNQLNKNINMLIHKINDSIHFQSKWEKISLHFSELFPSFLPQLKAKYPKLTESEIRHCMFLKLNLSIEEVAQILNIETTSVSSARYRLKKKMNYPAAS